MKRSIAFIMLIIAALFFASCNITIRPNTDGTAAPGVLSPPAYSPPAIFTDPPGLYTPPPVISGIPEVTYVPYSGPVILAPYGEVIGGFNDGSWMSHSLAASVAGAPMTFYEYNLLGCVNSIESAGLTEEDVPYAWSHANGMPEGEYDESEAYYLNLSDPVSDGDYASDPLSCTALYTVTPEALPAMAVITDFSALQPAVQQLIDSNLGAGAATAEIKTAISLDIDNDGKEEKIVNADNCAGSIYDTEAVNLYSIACLIESDGTVYPIGASYQAATLEDFSAIQLKYVQNIIDLDCDGEYEIVLATEGWEQWIYQVYACTSFSFPEMLSYGTGD